MCLHDPPAWGRCRTPHPLRCATPHCTQVPCARPLARSHGSEELGWGTAPAPFRSLGQRRIGETQREPNTGPDLLPFWWLCFV